MVVSKLVDPSSKSPAKLQPWESSNAPQQAPPNNVSVHQTHNSISTSLLPPTTSSVLIPFYPSIAQYCQAMSAAADGSGPTTKATASDPTDTSTMKDQSKTSTALEEDDEFEDFPVDGAFVFLPSRVSEF